MAHSGKVLHQLKVAGNYSKLAFHKDGPHSFKRGQGALIKVAYKFGKDGTISFRKLCGILGWPCEEVRGCAKKAQENGYVTFGRTKKGKCALSLTEKGREVLAKRLEAEDRTADEILRGFSEEELEQLSALCGRIVENCKGMGVDYRVIRVKRNGAQGRIAEYGGEDGGRKHGHGKDHKHGHGCKHHHGKQVDVKCGHQKAHGKKAGKKSCCPKGRGKKCGDEPVADWKGKKARYCKKVCKEDAEKCKCYQKHRRAHCKKHHGRK